MWKERGTNAAVVVSMSVHLLLDIPIINRYSTGSGFISFVIRGPNNTDCMEFAYFSVVYFSPKAITYYLYQAVFMSAKGRSRFLSSSPFNIGTSGSCCCWVGIILGLYLLCVLYYATVWMFLPRSLHSASHRYTHPPISYNCDFSWKVQDKNILKEI